MLDVEEDRKTIFITCDVPVGDGFCETRFVFNEQFDDKQASRSFILGIEGGPLTEAIPLSDPRVKIDYEALEEEMAINRMHHEQFKRAHKAALAAGWGEHIYPGEGSQVDGLSKTFGVNDLCPLHRGYIPVKERQEATMPGFTPLQDKVLIKPDNQTGLTPGGLVIPDDAQEKPQRGIVISAGNGKITENGTVVPVDVKPGDHVLYGKYDGSDILIEGVKYLIMSADDILGKFE